MHTQRTFAPEGESVPQARRFVRKTLEEWDAEDLTDEAVLATSELVTNAVIHAGTPVRVALEVDAQGLRLEVEDMHPSRSLPLGVERPSDDAESGRGLLIASAMAGAWGVDYSAGAKRVWLRLERGSASTSPSRPATARRATEPVDLGVAVVELSSDGEIRAWNHDAFLMLGWTAQEVRGRLWRDLVEPLDRGTTADTRSAVPSWPARRWQGMCTVRRKIGAPAQMFVSRVSRPPGEGWVMLLVPASKRVLLEWPAPQARSLPVRHDPLGLREDALNRLGFEAYLDLAVERSRDRLGAQAAYLLLARDLDGDFEVTTVSGLDASLVGTRLPPGATGAPDLHNPHLPVVLHDISETRADSDGEAGKWLLGEKGLRSLVAVPVVMEGRVIGALGVASERVAGFSDEEAVLLQRIGNVVAAAADRARLRVSERERRGWLTFLAETGDLLAGSLDQEMTMAITGQIVVPRLADWCAVYLDDTREHPVLQQVWHRDERAAVPLRAALEQTPPERIVEDLDAELRGSVRVIPLVARGHGIGVLVLGRPARDPLHGEALVVAESVARRASLAIDNARVHGELQGMGEALQRSLLPASIPSSPSFEVGVAYEAAGEASLAGGDFYDVFPVGSGRWCFTVGDVCGSGAEAAAVTGLARHTIRALALSGFPIATTLERLNTAIVEEGERSRFLTLVCGMLEPDHGGRLRMSLVCAGHPMPFVVRPTGEVRQVGRPQPLLGVLDQVAFVAEEHVLERGDLLVAVTDGVLERRDGLRMLEEQGLMADLARVGDLSAQAVAERIQRLVTDFGPGPQADDMAVLAIRAAPQG
ncbi:MAG TPA: SpoIIE family protein phosphatase [Nocardioidaceae bacterium]|nr:SpoIIE family protein phosphatase [Nocardioidaceae bacterium]